MSSRKNLVALAILLCLTTLVAAVAAGPTTILPATTIVNSHSTATGGTGLQFSPQVGIVPLSGPGGLASGALVNLDSNSLSQTDVSQQTTLSTAAMFRAGAILATTAPTVGQALVLNSNFKYVDTNN